MNSLSIMIYAASVSERIQVVLFISAGIVGIILALWAVFSAAEASASCTGSENWKKPVKKLWIPIALAVFGSVVPSQTTIYLIAASEAGETVVSSPEARELMGDLKEIIRRKLKEQLSDQLPAPSGDRA